MRLLLIDAGNARLKWAIGERGRIATAQVLEYRGDVASAVTELRGVSGDRFDAVAVSNVAGAEVEQLLQRQFSGEPDRAVWFARSKAAAGAVRNAYVSPQHLGVDRWSAVVGAFARLRASTPPASVCVADAGTALTIDGLQSDGRHLGGLILPGLALQRSALLKSTADIALNTIRSADESRVTTVFATDTADALAHSAAFACAAAIDRCAAELPSAPVPPRVLLTGGDSQAIAPWLATDFEICPNLVLEGLAILFEQRTPE